MPAKKGVLELHQMKRAGEKIAWLTAYDYPTAAFEQEAGIDMILVGDSLGMCVYGYPGHRAGHHGPVHRALRGRAPRGARRVRGRRHAVHELPDLRRRGRAQRRPLLKEAGVDAIKLEGGVSVITRVKAILDAGIVVCGHIGLTPQSSGQLGGHKAQGRTLESAKLVVEDARALYEAGVQLLLVEAVPPEVASFIRDELPIPVLGIGAGESGRRPAAHRERRPGHLPGLHPQVRQEVRRPGWRGHRRPHRVRDRRARRPVPRRAALLPHARGRARALPGLQRGQAEAERRSRDAAEAPPRPWAGARAARVDDLGTETVFAVAAEAAALAAQGRTVYPFHLGDLNLATPANIAEAATRALRDGKTTYCPNAGIAELREAIAHDVGTRPRPRLRRRERERAAGRQAGHRQVPAHAHGPRRRGALPQPGLSHLQLADRVLRRPRGALHLRRRGRRLRARPRADRAPDHAGHPAPHPERPAQPDRRRVLARRARGDWPTSCAGTTFTCSATRPTSTCATRARAARSPRCPACRSAASSSTRSPRSTR